MSKEITLKIDQKLLDKVKTITKNKFSLRNINSYAEAVREALIDFIKKNQRLLSNNLPKNSENHLEIATEECS